MCGIIAYFSFSGMPITGHLIEQMNHTQRLRGPDHSEQVLIEDGKIGLAHTRLSIIDLSSQANQPMCTSDKKRWIVFNGEIYNFKQVREKLSGAGAVFRTRSDTEVLLEALSKWGIDALEMVEGIFSFAYVDMEKGYLLAARDRVGVKPLAYLKTDQFICFASTLTPLTLLPGFSREIDQIAKFEMLTSKYVVSPRSIYKQIRKVEPGTWMKISFSGNVSTGEYWSLKTCKKALSIKARNEISGINALKFALKNAVQRQLTADVPVGVFLSGGIDSALMAAIASEYDGNLKSFTVGYKEPGVDESEDARATAKILGTNHQELIVTPDQVIDIAQSVFRVYDEPFGDASAIPTYLVSRFASQQVKVVLSGDGGDEQFFGYSRYHRMALIGRLIRQRPDWLKKILLLLDKARPRPVVWHALTAALGFPDEETRYTHYLLDNFACLAELAGGGPASTLWQCGHYDKNSRGHLAADSLQEGMMLADILNYLPDDCLTKVDRASMANSVEVRVPLLDEYVLNESLTIPISMKWRAGQGKYITRRILEEYLPKAYLNRPKKGFGVPLNKWLFNEMGDFTMALLTKKNLEKADLDYTGVQKIIKHHRSGRYDHQYFLWPLCCYVSWILAGA